ncbi:MAG: (2Fe-2S) ferredoxin domain-containing protein [Treponema sp.]|nr:(2Fe-2S) ferredoxin domain-containing protein [Treponema sp.]
MKIEVCLGSSCHVKGGNGVLEKLKNAIKKHNLENKVDLIGTVCLGECKSNGVNLKIDGKLVTGITESSFDAFFDETVLKALA